MTARLRSATRIAAFVLVQILVIAGLLWGLNQLQSGTDARDRQAVEIAALQAGLDEANDRLAEQGQQPVPVPSVGPGTAGQPPQVILGERGPAGVQGIQGRTGPPGETGPRGPLGPRGGEGDPGSDGTAGADGKPGSDGAAGATGPQGEQGPAGVHGDQGATGPAGAKGETGDAGPQGATGPPGPACPDGYSPESRYIQTRTDPELPLTEVWQLATICIPQEG